MTCVACRQGFKWECAYHGNCDTATRNNAGSSDSSSAAEDTEDSTGGFEAEDLFASEDSTAAYIVNGQDDSKLKDQQSTGRKRAAKMYPLAEGAPCEWQGKKNCGGGENPIIGCINGTQQARHHGPDKNTLNNEKGNVHRICHLCHNRWHARNDEGYVWGSTYNSHSPTAATKEEQANNEIDWITVKVKDVKD